MLHYEYKPIKKSKKTLLLIHGLGGSLRAWDPEVEMLNKSGYATLTIDLPGHGYSLDTYNPHDYSLQTTSAEIKAILEHENINKAVVVGHCYGGMVALVYANQYPDTLDGLVLIDTTYKSSLLNLTGTNLDFVKKILASLAKNLQKNSNDEIRDWDLPRLAKEIKKTGLSSYILSLSNTFTYDSSDTLSTITVPTLVIHGSEDSVIPETVSQEMHERIKNSAYNIIEDANHIVVLNNPEELTKRILDFLK